MRLLAITGNPKKKGALAALTNEVIRGAVEGGAQVEKIRLAEQDIAYCKFCMKCHSDLDSEIAYCVQEDDMRAILERIRDADGFIIACPLSNGHSNAYMKTFIERCTWTIGSPTRNLLFIKGCPEPRIADKQRYAVTVTTAGSIPPWARILCNGSTREMAELARDCLNAKVIGRLYSGLLNYRGLPEEDKKEAFRLGVSLTEKVRGG